MPFNLTTVYPVYYKNVPKGRYTAVFEGHLFLQISKRNTVRTFTCGKNTMVIDYAAEHDTLCSEQEFAAMLDDSITEFGKYADMIDKIQKQER